MQSDPRKNWILFGHSVREARNKVGFSQLKLAEKADLSLTYVSNVERGRHAISIDTIVKLGRAVGLSGAELLRRAGL